MELAPAQTDSLKTSARLKAESSVYDETPYIAEIYLGRPKEENSSEGELRLIQTIPVRIHSQMDPKKAFSVDQKFSDRKLFIKFKDGAYHQLEWLWIKREPGEDYATVQYDLHYWGSDNSPQYKIPLKDLARLIPSLAAGKNLSDDELWILFSEILKPKTASSWTIDWIRIR